MVECFIWGLGWRAAAQRASPRHAGVSHGLLPLPLSPRGLCTCSCLPVIIQDDVQLAFESVLDFDSFAIRIPQKDMHNVRGWAAAEGSLAGHLHVR